ncbi:MAG: hypothetical protein K8R25_09310 [Methanosarcinales archaeon]|nr:hypothetical protein [Methanosarcinales archaeon]
MYRIEEGTYVNSSPYSRAGLDHKDDDWLNLIGFENKIFECFGNIKTAISKKIIDIA